jgi:hypothetical protein
VSKALLAISLTPAIVLAIAAVKQPSVEWMNEANRERQAWHEAEHDKRYGNSSNRQIRVIYSGPTYGTWNFPIGVGTNETRVELGFRNDGVVVWRKSK